MSKIKNISCIVLILLLLIVSGPFGCGSIDSNFQVSTNKTEYYKDEEILVTAKGVDNFWVGVYRESDNIWNKEPISLCHYNQNGFISGQTYSVQKSFTKTDRPFQNFPQGEYKVIIFDQNNEQKNSCNFSIKDISVEVPEAPKYISYSIDDQTSGLANGSVTIEFEKGYQATDVVLYWANENGVLGNYTSLAPFHITSNPFTFEMYENTIIPSQATKIIAYGINSAGISSEYAEYDLPEGCQFNNTEALLSEFQVVSDVHIAVADSHLAATNSKEINSQHFIDMCNDVVNISPNSDALIIVGDIANSGKEYEWQEAERLLSTVSGLPNVYYSLGNHDLYDGYGMGEYSTQIEYFYKYAGVDSVYYEKTINGFHHIFLGSESCVSGVDADLSDKQLQFLDEQLNNFTTLEPNKPIFVYLHQSLYNTVAGSFEGQNWDGVIQDGKLRAILKKYPQVCMFNGHSHWDLNSRGSMHASDENLPNIFNTSSVAYLWTSYYIPTGEYLEGSQGYFVYVYSDKVIVMGRDFVENKWIPSACFEVEYK